MLLDASKADSALIELYDRLRRRNTLPSGSFTTLSADGRREYMRVAQARSRARHRASIEAGSLPPTEGNIRSALADAALMLLAVDGPGADQVRQVLAAVFHDKAGIPVSVETRARSGRLRPKLATGRVRDRVAARSKKDRAA
jgi:hypothetical protein